MKFSLSLFVLFLFIFQADLEAQDLQNERIRSISSRKRSIYLDRGIFHNGSVTYSTSLKGVRYNYSAQLGYERVVFDFSGDKVPKIYGHISSSEKKIYIDFFDTKLEPGLSSSGESTFVENLNFFPITEESLSVELNLKENATVDIFYLESPGRFVIDIKK
jgi:hypothetical protein